MLIFQDEMEIHRFPALTRMGAPVGQQPQVPTPGKNEKKVVYGGIDYQRGKLTYTMADTKCGAAFLTFLTGLLRTYGGRKIRLVCDNGPCWWRIHGRLRREGKSCCGKEFLL